MNPIDSIRQSIQFSHEDDGSVTIRLRRPVGIGTYESVCTMSVSPDLADEALEEWAVAVRRAREVRCPTEKGVEDGAV